MDVGIIPESLRICTGIRGFLYKDGKYNTVKTKP